MQVISEQLVEAIVRAVIAELTRRGVDVIGSARAKDLRRESHPATSVEIDFSEYRTPVLNERQVRGIGPGVIEIVVPPGTHCTEGARDLMQKRSLMLKTKSPSH